MSKSPPIREDVAGRTRDSVRSPARQPSRRQGIARVEAILDVAARLFHERGLEGTTMSAIAAESGTGPGSLYRFFPNRDLIWDALMTRYTTARLDQLDRMLDSAASMTTEALAHAIVADMRASLNLRLLVAGFIEKRADGPANREAFRGVVVARLAAVFGRHAPGVDQTRLLLVARVAQVISRGVLMIGQDGKGTDEAAYQEVEIALALYLRHSLRTDTAPNAPPSLSSRGSS